MPSRNDDRAPLSRKHILRAAVELADAEGLDALSMRQLGDRLGVKAMSLYNHVANKDDILDGMMEIVLGEIAIPTPGEDWRAAMHRRACSARAMFGRHPWAVFLMETRQNLGPSGMRYYDAIIRCLCEAGFSLAEAAHAFSVLDSYVYGFALQELNLPFQNASELGELGAHMLERLPADQYPYLFEMITEHALKPGYSYATEFEWGLELILDGLERVSSK